MTLFHFCQHAKGLSGSAMKLIDLSLAEQEVSGLECVRHAFDYVAYFVFLEEVWIRSQRAALACGSSDPYLRLTNQDAAPGGPKT